jgi:transcriptional regulator with XRE-family HTH domain
MHAGQKLLAWRKSKGLTQRKAAIAFGVTQPTWQGYEDGKPPATKLLQRLIEMTDGAVSLADYAESDEELAKRRAQREARTVRASKDESGTDVAAHEKAG